MEIDEISGFDSVMMVKKFVNMWGEMHWDMVFHLDKRTRRHPVMLSTEDLPDQRRVQGRILEQRGYMIEMPYDDERYREFVNLWLEIGREMEEREASQTD
jgi:hypothetical protein